MAREYSALPTGSTASLSMPRRRSHEYEDPQDSDTLDRNERGGVRVPVVEEADADEDENEKRGMLSGVEKEGEDDLDLSEGEVLVAGKSKSWLAKVKLRSILLSLLGITVILVLMFLFHPSSPAAERLSSYYHGQATSYSKGDLKPGTYSNTGVLADNPLNPDGKFGDIPFASVGGSLSPDAPNWAGGKAPEAYSAGQRWNGTHWYDKTVILVSLDGVRADYLEKGLTPHLLSISKKGLRSEYLQPVMPSLTFPNHWSLMTGLYPSSHGIVANDFVSPSTGKEFLYTDSTKSWASEWWGGEPLWSTVIKNGLRSANMMWPGPPVMANGVKPSLWYAFENRYNYRKKVSKIADWLDMPQASRPQFIAAYIPEVDQEGHISGPHSHEVERTLTDVDNFAKDLWGVLEERNLTGIVDVVFVSDHGMSDTHNERIVFLDDILGEEGFAGIASSEGWPSAGLRFQPHINATDMLHRLEIASAAANGGFKVYTHETMPPQWHFSGHERIAPIYVVPHVGWAVSNRHEFEVEMGGDFSPKGIHGYAPEDPSMHAIFIAHGPYFEALKSTPSARKHKRADLVTDTTDANAETERITVIPGFQNLEIYNLVCDLLDVKDRAPNNGTVGFWQQFFV